MKKNKKIEEKIEFDQDWRPSPDNMLNAFVDYYNQKVADFDVPAIEKEEAYVVWFNYTLGNAKALISTVRPDHMYYEVTYNATTDHIYVDQYVKVINAELERHYEE